MSGDREIYATPSMQVVPALVCIPEGAIDTLGDAQGVVIGAQHLDGFGPCLFIGTRMRDGTAQIGAIPPNHWPQLADVLNEVFGQLQRGEFDRAAVAS
ncbi:hypothetical protein [Sphingomonas sp. CCH15-F11]|uniref:hypothetical protein n=1 Tax=Sphingomonas sp. CCH15-F11 TaxID=1768785 RepID=UPI000835F574|nr:hypothetical protein [Sphingomonas sp. CCH15-F11]